MANDADEAGAGFAELIGSQRGNRGGCEDCAREILGVGGDPETNDGDVLLLMVSQERSQLGRFPDENGKHAGRVGIEGPAVPGFGNAEELAQTSHHLKGRDALAFVHHEDP